MSKFFLRWIDSWSDSENAQVGASSEYVIEKKIQWLRIIPFILLHIACLAAFWVGVSWFAVVFMLGFYFIRMFAITAFSTAIFRIKLFRHHVLFNSFCTDRNHECAARTVMVGSSSPLSPSLYRHRSGPAFSKSRLLVFACRLVLNEQNFATRKKSLKTG